jgi:hypothetical protein
VTLVRAAAVLVALVVGAGSAVVRADDLRGAVLAGGTVDLVGGAGWWAAGEAWFGLHGVRVDAFGERGAILVEGAYQAIVGNAWPNLVASVRLGAGADVRDPAPVLATGGELLLGLGLPHPLALAARADGHCLIRDGKPYLFATLTLGVGVAF